MPPAEKEEINGTPPSGKCVGCVCRVFITPKCVQPRSSHKVLPSSPNSLMVLSGYGFMISSVVLALYVTAIV